MSCQTTRNELFSAFQTGMKYISGMALKKGFKFVRVNGLKNQT